LATFAAFGGAHHEKAEVWADGWIPIYIIACRRQVVAFAPKVIKCAAYGVAQGRRWRYGWMGGWRNG
jgi:hypothetical protein